MSHSRFPSAVAFALLLAAPAAAQFRPYVAIENPQIGFKPGSFVNEQGDGSLSVPVAKRGQWAPVAFELKVLRKLDPARQLAMRLRVEARDADETRYTAYYELGTPLNGFPPPAADPADSTAPVNFVIASDKLPLRGAVKPGGGSGDVTLTIMTSVPAGERSEEVSDPIKVNGSQLRDPSVYAVVSLGSLLPGFDLPDTVNFRARGRSGLRGGRVETAVIPSVAEMPDHWFAYEAADLVVLPTGNSRQGFLAELFDPQMAGPNTLGAKKREALMEWVRRGGKLVVSIGQEADKLKQYPAFAELLPVRFARDARLEVSTADLDTGNRTSTVLKWNKKIKEIVKDGDKEKEVEKLIPNAPFWVAMFEPKLDRTPLRPMESVSVQPVTGGGRKTDLVFQAPVGLGRVTAVAFDLDATPFTALDIPFRQTVWNWIVKTAGSEKAAEPSGADRDRPNYSTGLSPVDVEDGAVAAIRRHVDEFEGVPVISFGWVALFILLYTILIGPVEYLFLKKIVGRLELTWITFPVIVLSVSAAAYFTAYAIKGKDLRINKIDLVDIDVAGQRTYGRTWFTVFSPRVDSYTVAVEPKAPWAAESADGSMVDWLGGVRTGTGGAGGFRSYRYELDGGPAGLVSVPIQVWSTKSFVANWAAKFPDGKPPVTADLAHLPADRRQVSGKITANLPLGNLQEAFAFFGDKAYKLDALPDGQPVRFDSTNGADSGWDKKVNLFDSKFASDDMYDDFNGRRTGRGAGVSAVGPLSLWGVLLGDLASKSPTGAGRTQNASLRALDQSWRLTKENTEEVMIIAKLARVPQPALPGQSKTEAPKPPSAEELMSDPASISPTKLWLRGLPGSGPREPVPGLLTQETYVRIFLPVRPVGGAK